MKTSGNSCRICSSSTIELLYDFSQCDIESSQKVRYLRCKKCGIVYNENIDDADICRLYSGDIYTKYSISKYGIEPDEYASIIANDLKREMNIIEHYVDKGRILDIGCARGYFLHFMYQNGWDVYGNDLSQCEIEMGKSRFGMTGNCVAYSSAWILDEGLGGQL